MRRFAAISLLAILFFNWYGYRLLSDFLQDQANTQLEARLDLNEYDDSQLIEMRVSLAMPYQVSSTEFERCDGEIKINGTHYKYVKRKVENGQLVLLCVPNETKMRLQSARDDFFKLVNDLKTPSQNKKSDTGHSSSFNMTTEYWQQKNEWNLAALIIPGMPYSCSNVFVRSSSFFLIPEQPPEVVAAV